MCKLFLHIFLSLCPLLSADASLRQVLIFVLAFTTTVHTELRLLPKPNEQFCFPRARNSYASPKTVFPWTGLRHKTSFGVFLGWSVIPGIGDTDPYHMPCYLKGWENSLDKEWGRGKCRHRRVGVVQESTGLTNQSPLKIHVCKTIFPLCAEALVSWALRGFTPRTSPGLFPNAFHNRAYGWPVPMALIKLYFV